MHNSEVTSVALGCILPDEENYSHETGKDELIRKDETSGVLLCLLDNDTEKGR